MEIKINVKEEHIINGKCVKARQCAIALAVRDIMPEVMVFMFSIEIDDGEIGYSKVANLPSFVSDQIANFDQLNTSIVGKARLEYIQPFSFVVNVDESILFPDKLLEDIEQIIEDSKNVELVTV